MSEPMNEHELGDEHDEEPVEEYEGDGDGDGDGDGEGEGESEPAAAYTGDHRCGFAAIVGRPNVGKSTLMNALVERKLSIVTPKPQTTRHRIVGILNTDVYQIAFVDTPGIHSGQKRALNQAMNRSALASLDDSDVLVFVVEALRFTDEDERVLTRIKSTGRPAILVVNKVDRVTPRERLLPFMAQMAERHPFVDVVPLSARRHGEAQRLASVIAKHLPVHCRCHHLGRARRTESHRHRRPRWALEGSGARRALRSERTARQAHSLGALGEGEGKLGGQRQPVAALRV